MKTIYRIFFLIAIGNTLGAQVFLKPTIGSGSLPADASTICAIPTYTGNFNASGLQAGDTIPHFQLYDINGNAMDVLTVLQTGKPLLLIGGNYTCPIFRAKFSRINLAASTFPGQINIYVVYGVEAHPKSPDVSPYSGTNWVTGQNQNEGILYLQPTTYGGRKQMVSDMLANTNYTLSVPLIIDGPCNSWWETFGPAPNNAYLIKPNGIVYKKHGWFDNPDDIIADINALLAITKVEELSKQTGLSVYPNPVSSTVNFDLSLIKDPAEVSIYEATGKQVFSAKNVKEEILKVNTGDLARGLYIYKISTSENTVTGKLLVE
jgi:hypothetical protein